MPIEPADGENSSVSLGNFGDEKNIALTGYRNAASSSRAVKEGSTTGMLEQKRA